MISHDHQLIFIHIPKCAGTSVERLFGHWDGFSGRHGQDHRPMRMIEYPISYQHAFGSKEDAKLAVKRLRNKYRKHANARNAFTVNKRQFEEYYKFTIVRDPWSRVYSWYRNVMNDSVHQKHLNVPRDCSFEDFVDTHSGSGMIAPANYWLRSFDGKLRLDKVINFADLQEGFADLCSDLGISGKPLPHHHTGGHVIDLAAVYTNRTREVINDRYSDEIERFKFSFPSSDANTLAKKPK